jgi:hypothetical protein
MERSVTIGRRVLTAGLMVAGLACQPVANEPSSSHAAPLTATAPTSALGGKAISVTAAVAAPRRDFRRRPPHVQAILARPGATGASAMQIVFDDPETLPDQLTLMPDGQRIVLVRDREAKLPTNGQVFATELPIPFDVLARSEKRNAETLRRRGIDTLPVFTGREIVGKRSPFTTLDPTVLDVILGGLGPLVDAGRSLLVNHPGVVGDGTRTGTPCTGGNTSGVWSFKHLMEEMANEPVTGTPPGALTETWLRRWDVNQVINGFSAPPRLAIDALLNAWPRDGLGQLDLAAAPFQLVAIINRLDLAGNPSYGGVGDAEGRFIFQLLDQQSCTPRPYLVIFEYLIPRHTCSELRDWAQQWMSLGTLALGTPAYNAALEAITEQFVARNVSPGRPNGSAIRQVRTNEIALGAPWELREFHLKPLFPEVPLLRQAAVAATPDASFNGTGLLAGWIAAETVPPAFLGAAAPIPPSFWNAPAVDPNKRHRLSLNTCSGCHQGETGTPFTHVSLTTGLSGFLTGITVADPVSGVPRSFDDLERRAQQLEIMANTSCFPGLFVNEFAQAEMIHPLPPIEFVPVLESE